MGLFSKVRDDKNKSQRDIELSRVSELLREKDYISIGAVIDHPLRIDVSQQVQAARLFLDALSALDRAEGPLSSFLGNNCAQQEKQNVANIVTWLLNSGLDPNTCIDGMPLAHAVIVNVSGSHSIELGLESLIRAGLNVNSRSPDGKTVLGALLSNGIMSFGYTADSFVDAGAFFNQADLADHRVYESVFQQGLYRVAMLIPSSSLTEHVKQHGKNSLTLLHLASGGLRLDVMRGDTKIFDDMYLSNDHYSDLIKMLIQAGADVNAKTNTGYDAISIAVRFNYMDTVRVLNEWAHKVGVNTFSDSTNVPISSKATELFLAAFDGNAQGVAFLLMQGADPNIRSYVNYDFLAKGAMQFAGMPAMVASLFFEQCMMKHKHPEKFFDMSLGMTNLHYPCLRGYSEVVHLLLEAGEDPSARSFHGIFPLYVAAEIGHLEIVQDLIEHGANIDQTTPNHCTALLNASEEGHVDVALYLLKMGANPYIANKFGATPLDGALRYGHGEVAEILSKLQ